MTNATKNKKQNSDKTTNLVPLEAKGLNATARFLKKQGYEILERCWKCKFGEIDFIALDEDVLVFVEVKTHSNEDDGMPEDSVARDKRIRLEKIAIKYLSKHDYSDIAVRFDMVRILVINPERAFLRHHINAFAIGE